MSESGGISALKGGKVDIETQNRNWAGFTKFMVWVGIIGAVLAFGLPYIVVF